MLRNDDAAASPGNARERRSGMDMPGTHADSEDRTAADNIVHVYNFTCEFYAFG